MRVMNCCLAMMNGMAHQTMCMLRIAGFSTLVCVTILLTRSPVHAAEPGPLLQQHGQHPVNAVIGVPVAPTRLQEGSSWLVSLEHGNLFMGGTTDDEALFLDGEASELSIRHRRRLSACWQAEASLPVLAHSRGFADRMIDDWHQFFGLPDAQRGSFDDFQLRYTWQDRAGNQRTIDRGASGLGDVQIALQRALACPDSEQGEARFGSLRVGMVLPTGESANLFGSGETGFYGDWQSAVVRLGRRGRVAASIGLALPGRSELFARQKAIVGYGSIGADLTLGRRWQANAQIDIRSAMHDSDLPELGRIGAALGVGVRYRATATQWLEAGIIEDVIVDTSPDIVARFAWRYLPASPR